jgi:peptidoglycan/xylan/chitin deacetylase (PgdA/CDA1 family)
MWPNDARAAMAFTFDFDAEEVWIGEDKANANRPGVLSQGTYGAKIAVPAILDLLARHKVRATFFLPARVAERHPGRVEQIVAAGHELAHHGYTHTSPTQLTPAEEEAELVRGLDILRGFSDTVTGYRSPSWEFTESTLGLLDKHGLTYSSNMMDDIRPYRHPNGIAEVPISWILDDAAHFWFDGASWQKKISTCSEVEEIWRDEFTGFREMGGAFVLTMHPQVIGRPSRLALLDRFLTFALGHTDVAVMTAGEIAARA